VYEMFACVDQEIYDLTGNDRSEAEGAESNQDQLSGILGGQITAEEREISRSVNECENSIFQ
jgi:predicted proteasome-type protease